MTELRDALAAIDRVDERVDEWWDVLRGNPVLDRVFYTASEAADFSLKRARRAFEAQMIKRALRSTQGNRTHAAKLLEISHRALLYKIKEYGIRDRDS